MSSFEPPILTVYVGFCQWCGEVVADNYAAVPGPLCHRCHAPIMWWHSYMQKDAGKNSLLDWLAELATEF